MKSGSLASHIPLQREEGSGHAVTIKLQKLDVTNHIRALCRSHSLSWSTIRSQCVWWMSHLIT